MEQETVSNVEEVKEFQHVADEAVDEPVISAVDDEEDVEEDEFDEDEDEDQDGDMDSLEQKVAIDLSDNEFYKGLCTLLEDEHGNNILEYISLLHTELIGVNKNLRLVRKEMNRMANCAEIMVKKGN